MIDLPDINAKENVLPLGRNEKTVMIDEND